jgi:hypothetical protein
MTNSDHSEHPLNLRPVLDKDKTLYKLAANTLYGTALGWGAATFAGNMFTTPPKPITMYLGTGALAGFTFALTQNFVASITDSKAINSFTSLVASGAVAGAAASSAKGAARGAGIGAFVGTFAAIYYWSKDLGRVISTNTDRKFSG